MYATFLQNSGKIFGLFAACFVAFILVLAILEQLGVGAPTIGVFFIVFPVAAYTGIAWLARTMRVDAWYVADRDIPALYNGMAGASGWLSGALIVALSGSLYFDGYSGLALITGWTGGPVLAGSLIAPYLAKSACFTVPEFLGRRFGGRAAPLAALAILIVASIVLLAAQLKVSAIIAERLFDVSPGFGMWAGLVAILLCSLPGGVRSTSWAQVVQYAVLAIAILVPVIWMSNAQGYALIPQFSYSEALHRIGELETGIGLSEAALPIAGVSVLTTPQYKPSGGMEIWHLITLALCMMAGTASLPHMLTRFFAAASPREARRAVSWSLLFILVLMLSLPPLLLLTKLQLLDPLLPTALVGRHISEIMSMEWVQNWSATGMLAIADQNADGMLQLNELFMRSDMLLLAAPEMAGMPYAISGLVSASVLAAMIAGGSALLLTVANSLSHDLYFRHIDPKADMAARLIVARGLLILIGLAAVILASRWPMTIIELVTWAFCFACSGLFFPLVLGIWWKRANWQGAVAGMIAGFLGGAGYLYLLRSGTIDPILGLDEMRFGVVGMTASAMAMVAATLATREPDAKIRRLVDDIRSP